MKQLLTLSFSLVIAFQITYSQNIYNPMAIEGATWIIEGLGYQFPGSWAYRIEGDTVINNLNYKKMYYYDLEVEYVGSSNEKEYTIKSIKLALFIRDEISEKKVYVYLPNSFLPGQYVSFQCQEYLFESYFNKQEVLLFDFSKTVGDTLSDCMLEAAWDDTSCEIVSEMTKDTLGSSRRVFKFDKPPNSELLYLIEGVGHTTGLFNTAAGFATAAGGIFLTKYCVGTNWDCQLLTKNENLEYTKEISIYPNPSSQNLFIQSNSPMDAIKIYDYLGQLCYEKIIYSNSTFEELNLTNIKSGLKLIEIVLESNSVWQTFIKI